MARKEAEGGGGGDTKNASSSFRTRAASRGLLLHRREENKFYLECLVAPACHYALLPGSSSPRPPPFQQFFTLFFVRCPQGFNEPNHRIASTWQTARQNILQGLLIFIFIFCFVCLVGWLAVFAVVVLAAGCLAVLRGLRFCSANRRRRMRSSSSDEEEKQNCQTSVIIPWTV